MRRRSAGILTDYRSVLDSRGDVLVGAYASAQRRQRIMVGAVGLALIGVAVGLYFLLRPIESMGVRGDVSIAVECVVEDCAYRGVLRVPPGTVFPVRCPACGAHSCHKLWECQNHECGHRFRAKGQPGEVRCERCGSTRVGTAETLGSER